MKKTIYTICILSSVILIGCKPKTNVDTDANNDVSDTIAAVQDTVSETKIELLPILEEKELDENVGQLFNDIKAIVQNKDLRGQVESSKTYLANQYDSLDSFWSHDFGGSDFIQVFLESKDKAVTARVGLIYDFTLDVTPPEGGELARIHCYVDGCTGEVKEALIHNLNSLIQSELNIQAENKDGSLYYKAKTDSLNTGEITQKEKSISSFIMYNKAYNQP